VQIVAAITDAISSSDRDLWDMRISSGVIKSLLGSELYDELVHLAGLSTDRRSPSPARRWEPRWSAPADPEVDWPAYAMQRSAVTTTVASPVLNSVGNGPVHSTSGQECRLGYFTAMTVTDTQDRRNVFVSEVDGPSRCSRTAWRLDKAESFVVEPARRKPDRSRARIPSAELDGDAGQSVPTFQDDRARHESESSRRAGAVTETPNSTLALPSEPEKDSPLGVAVIVVSRGRPAPATMSLTLPAVMPSVLGPASGKSQMSSSCFSAPATTKSRSER
jgi:hypothetical protein